MTAWDDAVNRELVAKLKALVERYPSEIDLLDDLYAFGGDVYELLRDTEEIEFKEGRLKGNE